VKERKDEWIIYDTASGPGYIVIEDDNRIIIREGSWSNLR